MKIVFFTISIFLAAFSLEVNGQSEKTNTQYKGGERIQKKDRYVSVGGGLTGAHYFGDLHLFSVANVFKFSRARPGIVLFGNLTHSRRFDYGVSLSWQRLFADDFAYNDPLNSSEIANYTRNLSFRNDLIIASAYTRIKFIKKHFNYADRPDFTPYIKLGIELMYSNPKSRIPEFRPDLSRFENGSDWTALRPLGTEGQFVPELNISKYNPLQIAIPVGIGFILKINDRLNFSSDLNFHLLFTDYIDDVSGEYVDLGLLGDDLAITLSDRSAEVNATHVNQPRNFEQILNFTNFKTYIGADGRSYTVLDGFGEAGNKRGDNNNRDIMLSMAFKLSYILSQKK